MSKVSPVVADVPAAYRDIAKKTMNEDAKHVSAHLTSFKRWLAGSPHLKVPDNDMFLLSFLRYAHYEHAVAQTRLDNYCTLRCSEKETCSQWFDYPAITDPLVDTFLNQGIFVPLGFVTSGTFFILIRLAKWDLQTINQLQLRIMNNMIFEQLLFDHRCQIGGFGLLMDMSETSFELAKQWGDRKNAKSAFRLMQEASPGRVKHLVFYNESKIFDFAFKLMEIWISEKMRKRMVRVKNNIDKAFKKIPGLKDIMPEEYGGLNGTMEKVKEKAIHEFKEFYSKPYLLDGLELDESKRPPGAKSQIKQYSDGDNIPMGSVGTFIEKEMDD